MSYDSGKATEMALAILYLNLHRDRIGERTWKGLPWEILDLLFEKGYISDPRSKAKSVAVTEEGAAAMRDCFERLLQVDD